MNIRASKRETEKLYKHWFRERKRIRWERELLFSGMFIRTLDEHRLNYFKHLFKQHKKICNLNKNSKRNRSTNPDFVKFHTYHIKIFIVITFFLPPTSDLGLVLTNVKRNLRRKNWTNTFWKQLTHVVLIVFDVTIVTKYFWHSKKVKLRRNIWKIQIQCSTYISIAQPSYS